EEEEEGDDEEYDDDQATVIASNLPELVEAAKWEALSKPMGDGQDIDPTARTEPPPPGPPLEALEAEAAALAAAPPPPLAPPPAPTGIAPLDLATEVEASSPLAAAPPPPKGRSSTMTWVLLLLLVAAVGAGVYYYARAQLAPNQDASFILVQGDVSVDGERIVADAGGAAAPADGAAAPLAFDAGLEDEEATRSDAALSADASGAAASADASAALSADASAPAAAPRRRRVAGPQMARAFARRQPALHRCFEEHALRVQGSPELEVHFDIEPDGRVSGARLLPEALASTALGGCVRQVALSTRFPAPGEAISVRIPLLARRAE
ncbi:MAG: hypothetical protein OEY14_17570, partial [Myxococcales bacterium]|nr:hypothetical protein [Myxococcales bacterium]